MYIQNILLKNFHIKKNRGTILIDLVLLSMQFMLTALAHKYDSTPIREHDKENNNTFFGLEKERYVSVIILSIDKIANEGYAIYRLPVERTAKWK